MSGKPGTNRWETQKTLGGKIKQHHLAEVSSNYTDKIVKGLYPS